MNIRGTLKRLLRPRFRSKKPESASTTPADKATCDDFLGRFREIVSDPINLLIERDPRAGMVEDGMVWLHNGNQVALRGRGAYYGPFSDVLIINRGVHEPLEEYVFQEMLRVMPDEPIMLELGAYWGHYSMWMKSRRPRSQVFLVEPDPRNLEAGRVNFEHHGYNGTFIQALVGKGKFEVDSFMAEHGYPRLNILHADIQGHEVFMLDDCAETFRRGLIDYIFVSTHSQSLHDQVVQRLSAASMRIEVSSGFDFESTSFDGLVFASRTALPPVFSGFVPLGRRDILRSNPKQLVNYVASLACDSDETTHLAAFPEPQPEIRSRSRAS